MNTEELIAAKDAKIAHLQKCLDIAARDISEYVAGEGEVQEYERHLREKDAEIARLAECLRSANAQSEEFERKCYLRGDEIEALEAKLKLATDALEGVPGMLLALARHADKMGRLYAESSGNHSHVGDYVAQVSNKVEKVEKVLAGIREGA